MVFATSFKLFKVKNAKFELQQLQVHTAYMNFQEVSMKLFRATNETISGIGMKLSRDSNETIRGKE